MALPNFSAFSTPGSPFYNPPLPGNSIYSPTVFPDVPNPGSLTANSLPSTPFLTQDPYSVNKIGVFGNPVGAVKPDIGPSLLPGTSLSSPGLMQQFSLAPPVADPTFNFGQGVTNDPSTGSLTLADFNKLYGSKPLAWKDISSPLPAYTAPAPLVKASYAAPYSKADFGLMNQATKGELAALGRYQNSVDAFRAKVASLPSLEGKAHARAVQDIGIMVKDIRDQQKSLIAQGQRNANWLQAAGTAAANVQKGIGADVNQGFQSAAGTVGSLAQGVSAGLGGATASDLASIANRLAPGETLPPNIVPGTGLATAGPAAQAALNQIQGVIPSTGLARQGALAQTSAEQQAAALQGGGFTAGRAALASGEQQANALLPQIVAADRQLPTLTNQYLDTLTTQRTNELNQQLQLLVQSGQISVQRAQAISDAASKTIAADVANTTGANAFSASQAAMQNAYNQSIAAQKNAYAQSIASIQASDIKANASGQLSVASANASNKARVTAGYLTYMGKLATASGSAKGGLTKNEMATQVSKLSTEITKDTTGDPSRKTQIGPAGATVYNVSGKPIPEIQDEFRSMANKYAVLLGELGPTGMDTLAQILATQYKVPFWTTQQVMSGVGPTTALPGNNSFGPPPDINSPAPIVKAGSA